MQKRCPLCTCLHTVDEQGTIPTWVVEWSGRPFLEYLGGRPSRLSPQRQKRLEALRRKYPEQATRTGQQVAHVGMLGNASVRFLHYQDAVAEYLWMQRILIERGDYEEQQQYLVIKQGERAAWDDLFASPDAYWEA